MSEMESAQDDDKLKSSEHQDIDSTMAAPDKLNGSDNQDIDSTLTTPEKLKHLTQKEIEMKDLANLSEQSVVSDQEMEEFEHIETSGITASDESQSGTNVADSEKKRNNDKNKNIAGEIDVNGSDKDLSEEKGENKNLDKGENVKKCDVHDGILMPDSGKGVGSSDDRCKVTDKNNSDGKVNSETEESLTSSDDPVKVKNDISDGKLELEAEKAVSSSQDNAKANKDDIDEHSKSGTGGAVNSSGDQSKKLSNLDYKFPEMDFDNRSNKGDDSDGSKADSLAAGTLDVPMRNVRKVSFTLGEGTISLEEHNYLMEKRRKSEANLSDERSKPQNQYRKHSSGDLHSRLKTRKLLGVGETDDGDVHRSKLSQILGHSDQLYIRLPGGLRIWQIVLAGLFSIMSVWALLFPTHYFFTMFEQDGSMLTFPIRLYATALVCISVMYWSTVHAADRDVIRLVLLSSVVFFTLQTLVTAGAQLSSKESFSRWSLNLAGVHLLFALIGYYFYWSVVSQRASCSLKRTTSSKELAEKEL